MAPCSGKFSALLLACLFGIPLDADVVPLTISQQASASGFAQACDPLCQLYHFPGQDDPGQSFSSSQTNASLVTPSLFVSGSATDNFSFEDRISQCVLQPNIKCGNQPDHYGSPSELPVLWKQHA